MIGLKRGTVRLVPHHKQWGSEFQREKKRLQKTLGDRVVDIQHIGSTAIPDLTAKPIIDISIGVGRFKDAQKLTKSMQSLGYGFYKKFGQQILFAKGPDAKRTHYVHVMRYKGAKWNTDILFRDYLRHNSKRAKEYGQLKLELGSKYSADRQKYSDGKDTFIQETLLLARKK